MYLLTNNFANEKLVPDRARRTYLSDSLKGTAKDTAVLCRVLGRLFLVLGFLIWEMLNLSILTMARRSKYGDVGVALSKINR